jgi:hypothetical protein
MRKGRIESEEFRWYECAHSWKVSNNQGLGKNKVIKDSNTFRIRLALGELFDIKLKMVMEWSEEYNTLDEFGGWISVQYLNCAWQRRYYRQ